MSEIKSTLDLIMEKTRHLSMNEEEKSSLKQKELSRKVRGMALTFLQGEKNVKVFVQEMNALPSEQQQEAHRLCLDCFLERLTPFGNNARILTGVENLLGRTEGERWEAVVREMKKNIQEKQTGLLEKAEIEALQFLASRGLQGPALLPVIKESRFWKEEEEKLVEAFQKSVQRELNAEPHK